MNKLYKLPENLGEDIDAHENDVKRFIEGDLAPGIFKARRVPRGIYEQRENGTYMMRVRVAGGTLTAKQAHKLADIAEKYGDLHVTTRQDVQIHNVAIKDSPDLMRELKSVGLTSKGGGGNTVRNVAACPFAGICPSEVFDVAPYAYAVTEYLITLEGSYNLPRKYKIAFSGCGADCALARINDLGFIAKEKGGQPGFEMYAGGGMGAISRTADLLEDWVPATDAIRIAEALRRVFDRTGDRHNRNKARLRFVFEKIGPEAAKKELQTDFDALDDTVPVCKVNSIVRSPESAKVPDEIKKGDVRLFKQHQDGFVAVMLRLPMGFISCADFRLIAAAAEKYSEEKNMITTRSQDILLRFIKEENLDNLIKALSPLSANVLSPGALGNFIACAGASTCRLGLCMARGAANASAKALDAAGTDTEGLQINISGCPNSCGQHPIAPIGFFGAAMRSGERLVPAYRVVLGAKNDKDNTRLSESAGMLPAREMPAFLDELAKDYRSSKNDDETFSSYYERLGKQYFAEMVKRHQDIPSYEENPDFYKDWTADGDFSLAGRGAGECGAGVFEVVSDDIAAAKKALDAEDLAEAFLCTIRALLITRGVDSSDPKEIQEAFEEHFVATNLIGDEYDSARTNIQKESVTKLLDKVETLYSTLDASLNFKICEPGSPECGPDCCGPAGEPVTEEYDLSGVACPMNFVKAKLKLEMLSIGDTLSIVLDDGEPVQNVPASFKGEGQEIVEMVDLENGHWRVVVKKVC